jgi:hypothetical protein
MGAEKAIASRLGHLHEGLDGAAADRLDVEQARAAQVRPKVLPFTIQQ